MPSRSNRASEESSLKTGVGERGSQRMRMPSPQAVRMRLPSGVNSPQLTAPVWPAKTCIVFPEGTAGIEKGGGVR